jgi:drug/metabolite transporter (DMT)-like permease
MPGVGNLIGMLLILPGLYVITSFGNEFMNTGDTITFFSAIGFSMYIVYLDHYSKIHNEFLLLFWQMISTSFFALLLALFSEKIIIEINLNFILLLLFLSLLGTLIAVYLQTKYQKLTSPVHAGILYAMEPVFAAIFAYFFLGEHPGPYFYPGAVLILAGVILSSVIDARTKRTRDKNVKYDRNAVKNL